MWPVLNGIQPIAGHVGRIFAPELDRAHVLLPQEGSPQAIELCVALPLTGSRRRPRMRRLKALYALFNRTGGITAQLRPSR